MRSYPSNSSEASARILALSMIVDGNLDPTELKALDNSKLLDEIGVNTERFQELLQELCFDMHITSGGHGAVELDKTLIDHLLAEITQPDLRRKLLRAMWSIVEADGWLADGEAVLLARACNRWSAEFGFVDQPGRK